MHATSAHAHLRKKRIILRKMKRNHTNKIVRGQFEKKKESSEFAQKKRTIFEKKNAFGKRGKDLAS